MTVYYKIAAIARRKKISQTKLAQQAELDPDRMRKLWQQATSDDINITVVVLERIALALGVNINELIDSNSPDSQE